jgi:hypothetical protein
MLLPSMVDLSRMKGGISVDTEAYTFPFYCSIDIYRFGIH